MSQIKNIIQGHFNEIIGKNSELSQERLKVCYSCPIYSYDLGGRCNNKLWLNPNTGDVSTVQKAGYVRGCNCRLNAKTRLINEQCPAGKW